MTFCFDSVVKREGEMDLVIYFRIFLFQSGGVISNPFRNACGGAKCMMDLG